MPDEFPCDVFLSHSEKDKAVVRPLAERLRADGVKVWFDEWVLKPGDSNERNQSKTAKIEEGLERSRVRVLCMSAHAFGSDWAQLESGMLRTGQRPFRDPLNKGRCFLRLRAAGGMPHNMLPPHADQTRIVAEVERRLSVLEQFESVVSVVSANLQRATRLRQSILQKAFTGTLTS